MRLHTYSLTLCGPYHRRLSTRTLLIRAAKGLLAVLVASLFFILVSGCNVATMPGAPYQQQAGGYQVGYSHQTAASLRGQAVRLPQASGYAPAVRLPQQIGGPAMFLVERRY